MWDGSRLTGSGRLPRETRRIPYLVQSVKTRYQETPDLCLSIDQASRLFDLEQTACEAIFDALCTARVLVRTPMGFMRPDAPEDPPVRQDDRAAPDASAAATSGPGEDDILVTRANDGWTVRARDSAGVTSFPTHDGALRRARALASRRRVDVWLSFGGTDLVKLPGDNGTHLRRPTFDTPARPRRRARPTFRTWRT